MLPGLSPDEMRSLLLSVGSHRDNRDVLPLKVAELFDKAIKHGAKKRDCAISVHFDGTSMVSRFLKLLDLIPNIQLMVDWGKSGTTIGFTTASELARLDKDDQLVISGLLLKHQLTSGEIKKVVRIRFQTNEEIEQCIEKVLQLRPQIITREVFIGAIVTPELKNSLSNMPQENRNKLFKEILKTHMPNIQNCGHRLSPERFLIVGGKTVAQELNNLKGGFEVYFNDCIKEVISTYE